MKKSAIGVLIYVLLFSGCTIGFLGGRHGGEMAIVPALPVTLEIEADQPYYQDGYYYSQRGDEWFYSQSQQGPWSPLPRSHYPREVRYKHHDNNGDNGRGHDEHGHDDQDRNR